MVVPPHYWQLLLWRLCSQMLEPPPYLHCFLMRLCSQMLAPPHCWCLLRCRLCSQIPDPPHCLHWLLMRLCLQMPSPLHCLHILKIRRCSHVLDPSHCRHWLFWRLCGHFARFFFTASPIDLLPPTPSSCCCSWASLASSDKGCFLISTASSFPLRWKLPCLCSVVSFFLIFSIFSPPAPPPPSPRSPCPVPLPPALHASRDRRFSPTFFVFMSDPAFLLSEARTSLDNFLLCLHLPDLPHDDRHLALLSRQIVSFDIPPALRLSPTIGSELIKSV
jgi:hypothetical protein